MFVNSQTAREGPGVPPLPAAKRGETSRRAGARCQATRPKVLAAGSIRGAVIAGLLLHGRGDVPGADVSALTLGGGSDRRAGPGGSRKAAASDRALADELVAGGLPVAGENPPGRSFPGWARLAGEAGLEARRGHRRRGARRPPALVVGPRRRTVGLGPPSSASAGRVGARESVTVAVGFEPRIAASSSTRTWKWLSSGFSCWSAVIQARRASPQTDAGIAPDQLTPSLSVRAPGGRTRRRRRGEASRLSGVPVPPGCGGRPGWSATGDVVSGAQRRAGRTTQPRRPARGAGGGSRFEGSSGAGQTRRPPPREPTTLTRTLSRRSEPTSYGLLNTSGGGRHQAPTVAGGPGTRSGWPSG